MVRPRLSDLYNRHQIAKKWYRALIGSAMVNCVLGSPLFTTRSAWFDPVYYIQLAVTMTGAYFILEKALTTEDYKEVEKEIEMASLTGIPIMPMPKEPKP